MRSYLTDLLNYAKVYHWLTKEEAIEAAEKSASKANARYQSSVTYSSNIAKCLSCQDKIKSEKLKTV